jgi:hypothetical protein
LLEFAGESFEHTHTHTRTHRICCSSALVYLCCYTLICRTCSAVRVCRTRANRRKPAHGTPRQEARRGCYQPLRYAQSGHLLDHSCFPLCSSFLSQGPVRISSSTVITRPLLHSTAYCSVSDDVPLARAKQQCSSRQTRVQALKVQTAGHSEQKKKRRLLQAVLVL